MGSRYTMTLKRDASGAFKDRIRLPEDVSREYQVLYGRAWEEKFRSGANTSLDKARAEHAAWTAKVKGRIGGSEGMASPDPMTNLLNLTHTTRPRLIGAREGDFLESRSGKPQGQPASLIGLAA